MRRKHAIVVAVVLMLIAACTPETASVHGKQHLTVETTGRHQWVIDDDVSEPGYHVGLADDRGIARVTGEAIVNSSDGHQLRVTVDVSRLGATLHGTIVIADLTASGDLVGIVDMPVEPVLQSGSTTTVALTAEGGNAYRGSIVPATISLTLQVESEFTSDRELVIGTPTPIGSLAGDESRSWTLSVVEPSSLGLSVGGGASNECPDLEVLDPAGTVIAGLGGCGYRQLELESAGTYEVRETAGESGDIGDSSILVTNAKDAGLLARDVTVGAPELAPGQYAVWKLAGTAGERLGVAGWSSNAATWVELIKSDGTQLATSGSTGGGRTAFAVLPETGEYTVRVTNGSAQTAVQNTISVRASTPVAGGAISDDLVSSPELLPGATVAWTKPGTATSVLTLDVDAAADRCVMLRVLAPGNPLPTETQGCGHVTATRVAVTDGDWMVEVTNLDATSAPVGAFSVAARPPFIAPPLAVGLSETVNSLESGSTVRIPVIGGTEERTTFRIDGVDGECYSALVRFNGSPTGAGSGLCNQTDGTAEVETTVPALGDFTIEVSSNGVVPAAGPVTVTALKLEDVDAGALSLGNASFSPALTVGDRAVWSHALPGEINQLDFELALDSGATGCVYFDTQSAEASPSPLVQLCPGGTASMSRVFQDEALLRASAENPLGAGALSVRATVSSDNDGAASPALTAPVVPSQHSSYVEAPNVKSEVRSRSITSASLSGPNATNVNQACKDVLFVGLRGSGQPDGYGPQVWSAFVKAKSVLAGRLSVADISIEAPDYIANPVPATARISSWQNYFDGINKGSDALYSILQARRHCHETIILGGYSQGAMAVHRTLIDLAVNQDTETLSRLAGAVLIADGDRRHNDDMTTYGSAGRVYDGIAQTYGMGGARPTRLTSGWTNTIRSVCNARDFVCDHFVPPFVGGIGTHKKYTNTQPVWDAAGAAAQRAIYLHGLSSGSWPGPNEPISSCLITTTLTWSGPGDVDLHVQEPTGRHVYYSAKQGSAGYLDVDNTTGYGPEHYYASCNSDAALGDFIVGVTNYAAPASTPIQVNVASSSFSSGPISIDIGPPTGSSGMSFPLFRLRVSRGPGGAVRVQQLPV